MTMSSKDIDTSSITARSYNTSRESWVLEENESPSIEVPPKKYSEAYFTERIQNLQVKIKAAIPKVKDIDPRDVFTSILESLEAAKDTLQAAKDMSAAIQEEQKKHPDETDWTDPAIVKPTNRTVDSAQATFDQLEVSCTNAGCNIVESNRILGDDGVLHLIESDLLECTVLIQATPKNLAKWCEESPQTNQSLLDKFLSGDSSHMRLFLAAGGPSNGNYGTALTIYDRLMEEIRTMLKFESPSQSVLSLWKRLALAVALELATPVPIFQQDDLFVDPIERFRYYAEFSYSTHMTQENPDVLDPAFQTLSVWELRKVVDANATHIDLTWGREFLRNYRPDQVWMEDPKWRYVVSVRTDVGYKQPDHEFNNYQELLSAGGECGPRAFFGRFISKAWGIPTWGVRQPGHAAMTRWTGDHSIGGWTVCLGAGWEYSWWNDNRYGATTRHGPDFLEETQARTAASCPIKYFESVVLMECVAECLGETVEEDFTSAKVWRSLALAQRKMLTRKFLNPEDKVESYVAEESKVETKSIYNQVGSTMHHSIRNWSTQISQPMTEGWTKADGTIVIPAASFTDPSNQSRNVIVTGSFLGGKQVHLEHDGYVVYELPPEILPAGSYALSITIVNVHRDQKPIVVSVEGSSNLFENSVNSREGINNQEFEIVQLPQGQELPIQYTKGNWEETKSIVLVLSPRDRLKLSRSANCHGLSMKDIFLKPVYEF